ncbi:hypothetical protein BAOM_4749 [Peribacillus asahii]|uniref:Uncharacterized protein n=1 Tax=Peribacillus asahii TaxID=228899 RepID=A0A3T0KYC3_9BACI|nr:hypothetical protein [Peribacillus asahii]AZV45327.1 hypothetical protein BAOM_4749 [Peribacillus asahii]
MISSVTKKAFHQLLQEAVDNKGRSMPNLTVSKSVEELSIKLSGSFKKS